jgi:hypothetical protein
MNRLLFITIVTISSLFFSCSKEKTELINDYTNPENLVGTTWKTKDGLGSVFEYAALKFTSLSLVEGWTKVKSKIEIREWIGTFTIIKDTITIINSDEFYKGPIEGEIMNLEVYGSNYVFKKQ